MPDGSIVHAHAARGDAHVMLGPSLRSGLRWAWGHAVHQHRGQRRRAVRAGAGERHQGYPGAARRVLGRSPLLRRTPRRLPSFAFANHVRDVSHEEMQQAWSSGRRPGRRRSATRCSVPALPTSGAAALRPPSFLCGDACAAPRSAPHDMPRRSFPGRPVARDSVRSRMLPPLYWPGVGAARHGGAVSEGQSHGTGAAAGVARVRALLHAALERAGAAGGDRQRAPPGSSPVRRRA